VTGANQADKHLKNALYGRDFSAELADLRMANAGDACPRCGKGRYRAFRGIEVGHVFYLGTKYSQPMRCTFLDAEGKERVMPMGCYGIGITRIAAAAIEQNHDADGIIWPMPIAPFQVEVVAAGKEEEVTREAERLYEALRRTPAPQAPVLEGSSIGLPIEVLYDDRDERPGVKFKDADLLGIPVRVTIGKKGLAEGIAEVKRRKGGAVEKVPLGEAEARVRALVQEGMGG
jgi:prolyl-tRNA synthetase